MANPPSLAYLLSFIMPKFQPDAYAQAAEDLPGFLFAAPLQRPAPKGSRQALDRLASSRQAAAAAELVKERAAAAHDRRRLCRRLLAAQQQLLIYIMV